MRFRRAWREQGPAGGEVDIDEVVRDTEESIFAALTESDTGFEALHDTGVDADRRRMRQRLKMSAAGAFLAVLWFVATRRRS
jgi:hypothetical protein